MLPCLSIAFKCALYLQAAVAQEVGKDWEALMREAAWDWHPGDMIFRNGMSRRDELIRAAEGGD